MSAAIDRIPANGQLPGDDPFPRDRLAEEMRRARQELNAKLAAIESVVVEIWAALERSVPMATDKVPVAKPDNKPTFDDLPDDHLMTLSEFVTAVQQNERAIFHGYTAEDFRDCLGRAMRRAGRSASQNLT